MFAHEIGFLVQHVEDEFAIRLADGLYDRLFRQRQPLPQAIRLTLDAVVGARDGATAPGVLSAAAPALFGPRAADLVLVPALMELLGRANWWLPPWLARVLPGRNDSPREDEPLAASAGAASG